jgi:hypothetical protein
MEKRETWTEWAEDSTSRYSSHTISAHFSCNEVCGRRQVLLLLLSSFNFPPLALINNADQGEQSNPSLVYPLTNTAFSQRSQPPSKRTKSSSSRSSLKPSLLPLSTKVQQTKAKKSGKNKSRDADVREKLDEASRVELRAALEVQPKVSPLSCRFSRSLRPADLSKPPCRQTDPAD